MNYIIGSLVSAVSAQIAPAFILGLSNVEKLII